MHLLISINKKLINIIFYYTKNTDYLILYYYTSVTSRRSTIRMAGSRGRISEDNKAGRRELHPIWRLLGMQLLRIPGGGCYMAATGKSGYNRIQGTGIRTYAYVRPLTAQLCHFPRDHHVHACQKVWTGPNSLLPCCCFYA